MKINGVLLLLVMTNVLSGLQGQKIIRREKEYGNNFKTEEYIQYYNLKRVAGIGITEKDEGQSSLRSVERLIDICDIGTKKEDELFEQLREEWLQAKLEDLNKQYAKTRKEYDKVREKNQN